MSTKKLGIMQPYFFPYLGYFSLIKHVDEFILFDTPQFIRHGWIERNRILKYPEGWLYVRVPLVKHEQKTAIKNVAIDSTTEWKNTILAQMGGYKKTAPNYQDVRSLVEEALGIQTSSIVELNAHTLRSVCKYLGIETPIRIFSEMGIKIDDVNEPDEWALNICKALGGDIEYWNPPGGEEFFSRKKYQNAGIGLKFHKVAIRPYDQRRPDFEAGLSIIDVLMFNSIDDINTMLNDYELL